MFQRKWRDKALVDVVNLALGAFLFLSPWIFGFTSELAWHTSWMAGSVIVIVAIMAIAAFVESEEWVSLTVGLWLAVCPWILEFPDPVAMQVHLVVGLVVAALAGTELWLVHRAPPHVPT